MSQSRSRPADDGILHPVHGGMQMPAMHQKGRQLRVARRAPEIHHHVLRHAGRQRLAALLGNQVQRQVDARGDPGAGRDRPIHDEDAVVDHLRRRRQRPAARPAARGAWCSGGCRAGRPARASSAPEQIATRRCGGLLSSGAASRRRREPLAVATIAGVTVLEVRGRLADQHHPGRRAQLARAAARDRPRPSPTEVETGVAGPAKRRRKRGGRPRSARCRLARRNASAGPAMSSSSECGAMTNRRSIW